MSSPDIDDDTPIYRIFNLFDIISTIENRRLRLAQASEMEDINEGLGAFLTTFNSRFGPNSSDSAHRSLDESTALRASQYITCWTRSPDNIAVWALYSPSYEGILVQTSFGRLKRTMNSFYQARNFRLAHSLEPNDTRDLFYPPTIDQVKYVDFSEIWTKLLHLRAEHTRQLSEAFTRDHASYEAEFIKSMEWLEAASASIFSDNTTGLKAFLLKDRRYEHEKEVRAAISLVRRDHRTKDQYRSHPLAGLDDPVRSPRPTECPRRIDVPLESDFIQSIQLDGRLPAWKQDAIGILFSRFGYAVSTNNAFDPIPDIERWKDMSKDVFEY